MTKAQEEINKVYDAVLDTQEKKDMLNAHLSSKKTITKIEKDIKDGVKEILGRYDVEDSRFPFNDLVLVRQFRFVPNDDDEEMNELNERSLKLTKELSELEDEIKLKKAEMKADGNGVEKTYSISIKIK